MPDILPKLKTWVGKVLAVFECVHIMLFLCFITEFLIYSVYDWKFGNQDQIHTVQSIAHARNGEYLYELIVTCKVHAHV
jgi:hypothetical protein